MGSPEEGRGGPVTPPPRGELRPAKPALYLDEEAVASRCSRRRRAGSASGRSSCSWSRGGIAVAIQWDAIAPAIGMGGANDDALVERFA
ncbi:MAG: hypothetical protein R3B99_12960 [Polyangiales bacterium]